jgi:hypothetical protein
MGLFFKSSIERQLEKFYVTELQKTGMSLSEAKSTVRLMLTKAKEEAEKEGTLNLLRQRKAQNLGDILLEKEATDDKFKTKVAKLRKEGVTDEDLRWWWNMHELERRMLQQDDFFARYIQFLKQREDGLTQEEALKKVGKHFPIFGDPDDSDLGTGDDRRLPYELKDRINIYVEKRSHDKKRFKKEIEESSSFNALVRKKIKEGYI